jgi:hypothetical protein
LVDFELTQYNGYTIADELPKNTTKNQTKTQQNLNIIPFSASPTALSFAYPLVWL